MADEINLRVLQDRVRERPSEAVLINPVIYDPGSEIGLTLGKPRQF